MPFTGNWSVVFGETPSAAKWNQLGDDIDDLHARFTNLFNYQTDNANSIASVNDAALKIQVGWGQKEGIGATSMTESVSFPEAFTTILGVQTTWLAAKATSAAATIAALDTAIGTTTGFVIGSEDITTSGFGVYMGRTSGNFTATTWYGYSWMAWGL